MESNPYSAPTADLSVANDDLISGNFQRFSAWWVFLLTFVTLGIYPVYWVYTRAQTVNRIQEDQIAPAWIHLMAIGLVLSFVADFVFPENVTVYLILYLTYVVTYVASLFKVKNRLNKLMSKSTGSHYELSPVMTFFFNSIYLQYKINEFIDNSQPQGEV